MKTCMRMWIVLAFAVVLAGSLMTLGKANPAGPSGYQVVKTVPLPGDGFWDYVGVDSDARRIYVSHGTKVLVLDADSFAVVEEIPDTQGVHGIAVAPELGRGFITNGQDGTVTVFDPATLKKVGSITTGGDKPDAVEFDPEPPARGFKRAFQQPVDHRRCEREREEARGPRRQSRIDRFRRPRQCVCERREP